MISIFSKILKYFLITLTTLVGLTALLLCSIWVAGPHLFPLENYKNILFASSEITSSKGQIYLAYFFPPTKEITVLPVQSDQVSVLGGYGDYELKKVLPLLLMERKKTDFQLAAMSWSTQTVIDQIARTNVDTQISTKKQLQNQLWLAAMSRLATPATSIEFLKAFFFARSIPPEQIAFESNLTPADQLNILDHVVLYEGCSVAVVNTTEQVGLAREMSDLLEKNGAVVVRVIDQNSPYQLSTFSLSSDNNSCQLLSNRLKSLFPGEIVQQYDDQFHQKYRADLVIFIGKDFANLI